MLQRQKVDYIIRKLDACFPEVTIPLNHTSPFTLLIAVLLSAQCTDERVNQITPQLFALADTPKAMSQLEVEMIEKVIRPLGLAHKKAIAIQGLSELLVKRFNEIVPSELDQLVQLPGVGRKTAQVVQAQCFDLPAFPVDTHIHRLAKRWGLTSGSSVLQTERDLKRLFPKHLWSRLHLQMIYYGRTFCPAKKHRLDHCVICSKLHNK